MLCRYIRRRLLIVQDALALFLFCSVLLFLLVSFASRIFFISYSLSPGSTTLRIPSVTNLHRARDPRDLYLTAKLFIFFVIFAKKKIAFSTYFFPRKNNRSDSAARLFHSVKNCIYRRSFNKYTIITSPAYVRTYSHGYEKHVTIAMDNGVAISAGKAPELLYCTVGLLGACPIIVKP